VSPRVFFWVQHLLGIGHLRRAATLARGLAQEGFDVLLVSGGAQVPGLDLGRARLEQLPPLRARDAGLRELSRLDGTPPDDAFQAARTGELIGLLQAEAPDIVITEQFPFGRTRLRFELLPLLEAAKLLRKRPRIFASVRDVLRDTASAARIAEMLEIFDTHFDGVLVHADPGLITLDRSFAGFDRLRDRVRYTGYVAESDLTPSGSQGTGEVIVSVGGGAVGAPLLRAVLAARPLTALKDRTWRLLLGANLDPAEAEKLRRAASAGVPGDIIVEPARGDFVTLLANAALSISQAGYNTVVETLSCADRAVLVPFATERETEQTIRARAVVARGGAQMVAGNALDGPSLAAAVERALAGASLRSLPKLDVNGVAATAALLRTRL
jgi:predicted glycosyltransferase